MPDLGKVNDAFDKAARHVRTKKGFSAEMLADKEVRTLINEIYEVLAVGVVTGLSDDASPELQEGMHITTYRFAGFKTYHEMNEVCNLLDDGKGGLKPFTQFISDVNNIGQKHNENYLRSEYHLIEQSALMADKWEDISQGSERYDLQYRTAGDEKVREEHARLNGTTLPPDDPFWDSYYPPNGYGCRCTVVQVRKGKYKRSDSSAAIKTGNAMTDGKLSIFRFNPGKTRSAAPPKHPYLPNPDKCNGCIHLSYDYNDEYCKVCIELKQCRYATNRELYKRYNGDPDYSDVKFNRETGGMTAIHKDHNFDKNGGEYEKNVMNIGYNIGHSVILESERNGKWRERFTDGLWDDKKFEIAGCETAIANNILSRIKHCASKRNTAVAILYYPKGGFDQAVLNRAIARYKGLEKLNDGQYLKFEKIICIQKEDIVMTIDL